MLSVLRSILCDNVAKAVAAVPLGMQCRFAWSGVTVLTGLFPLGFPYAFPPSEAEWQGLEQQSTCLCSHV